MEKRKEGVKNLLCEGYQAMYEFSKKITDEFEDLDTDSLKYVD